MAPTRTNPYAPLSPQADRLLNLVLGLEALLAFGLLVAYAVVLS